MKLRIKPYDWEEYTENPNHLEILCWALDEKDEINLFRIANYPVSCIVELPLGWNQYAADILSQSIRKILKDDQPTKCIFRMAKRLYYYSDILYPFLELHFNTYSAMEHCIKFFESPRYIQDIGQSQGLIFLESKIKPLRKMLTERNCQFSQWIDIEAHQITDIEKKISTINNEFVVDYQTINPIDSKLITHPRIGVFDIECYSIKNNQWIKHRPFPNSTKPSNVVYMVSMIFQNYKLKETRKKKIIVYGNCPEIEACEVIKVKSEKELCDRFIEEINREKVVILSGYNIHDFDYVYLNTRLSLMGGEWKPEGSLLKGKPPILFFKEWESSAYGKCQVKYLKMSGRISLDLFPIIKRDFKLRKYKLDVVAKKFIGRGKHDVSPEEIFQAYDIFLLESKLMKICEEEKYPDNTKFPFDINQKVKDEVRINYQKSTNEIAKIAKYCIEDSELVIDIFDKINVWTALVEMSNICGIIVTDVINSGQGIRGTSLLYDAHHRNNTVMTEMEFAYQEYCGAVVIDPTPGLYDDVMCLDFNSLYPSIIIAQNICHTTFVPQELWTVVPKENCNIIEWDEDPKEEDEEDDNENDSDYDEDGEKPIKPKQKIHYEFRFIKKEIQEGVLPRILKELLAARKATKKQMKTEKDPVIKSVLEEKQKAQKVCANSLYGYLGFQGKRKRDTQGKKDQEEEKDEIKGKRKKANRYPLIFGAMCTTSFGRITLRATAKKFEELYKAFIVTGDTDSILFTCPDVHNGKEAWIKGRMIEKAIVDWFPKPLTMELEKVGRMFCEKKKRYNFWKINEKTGELYPFGGKDDEGGDALISRGGALARRDGCIFQQEMVQEVMDAILNRKNHQEVIDIILEKINILIKDKVPSEDLAVVKVMGSNYKAQNFCMKIFGDRLTKEGKPVSPGDRLEYVICEPDSKEEGKETELLGYRMVLLEDYVESLSTNQPKKIDYKYYVEHLFQNPIEQPWQISFGKDIEKLEMEQEKTDYYVLLNQIRFLYPKLIPTIDANYPNYKDNIKKLIEEKLMTVYGFKTKLTNLMRSEITGRKVIKYRINQQPIKLIGKAIERGDFDLCLTSLGSKELIGKISKEN